MTKKTPITQHTSYQELADMAARGDLEAIGSSSGSLAFSDECDLAEFMLANHPGGRPNLGASRATGHGRSPRRQVRLPEELNKQLDSYATARGESVSDVIRDALTHYLASA